VLGLTIMAVLAIPANEDRRILFIDKLMALTSVTEIGIEDTDKANVLWACAFSASERSQVSTTLLGDKNKLRKGKLLVREIVLLAVDELLKETLQPAESDAVICTVSPDVGGVYAENPMGKFDESPAVTLTLAVETWITLFVVICATVTEIEVLTPL
jgi:hypothetical protein